MGAWDDGPFENDDASDFWYAIRNAKNPAKVLKECLGNNNSGCEHKRRAAAAFIGFLDRFNRKTIKALKKDAQEALEDLLNSDFADDWTEPKTIKKLLKKELKALK